jgi:Fe2+ or Zn2+ uptake regulation protein
LSVDWQAVASKRQHERSYRGLALPAQTRLTPQRRAVLDAIEETDGRFTALELFQRARRSSPRLGLATTYRTLDLLRRTGSLHALSGDGSPAYVRCSPEHHHHLVCLSCGSVEDTELCATPSQRALSRRHGFRAESHELEIYGTCRHCA